MPFLITTFISLCYIGPPGFLMELGSLVFTQGGLGPLFQIFYEGIQDLLSINKIMNLIKHDTTQNRVRSLKLLVIAFDLEDILTRILFIIKTTSCHLK
ncbi:hypothetical protein ABPG74_015062 [Tetrahymena malaccensis]